MKNFFRSLRYLRPYRTRLAIGVLCVVLIAVLWAGGLGMILPGTKILISPEGLHGWAWNAAAEDRLGATLVQRVVPEQVKVNGRAIVLALDVVRVEPGGPADAAGLEPNRWLIGLAGEGVAAGELLRADALARRLADGSAGEPLGLRVYDPAAGKEAPPVRVAELAPLHTSARLLSWVARRVPEPQTYPDRMGLLLGLLALVWVLTIARDVLRFVQGYLVQSAVYRGIMDLRCDNYAVVLRMPTTYFSQQGVSDTMSRFVQDTAELGRGQVTLFGKTLVEPAKAAATIALAMLLSWKLTLLAMVAGPPAYVLIRKLGKRMRRASRRALESWSRMLGVLEETLGGIRAVKAYTMEGTERRRFFRRNRELLTQQKHIARIDAATAPGVEALGVTAALGAVALAGYWVFHAQMNPERFLTLMALLAAMFDPVRKLAKVVTRFQRAEAAAARVLELQTRPQEREAPGAAALGPHRESIEFRGVCFRYPGAAEDALRDIDLTIEAGQTLAIVGPNGSGKTTLASLVPRLIDPTAGQVCIDGRDLQGVTLRSLREQIGLVSQETVLFQATIAENIAYGRRRATREEVVAAARRAFVDEFVAELPDGYDTQVGERGATLSGGQRQRIAIARAILRDPAILIFDEAMSQIDAESERRITEAMREFVKGRTTLTIAHRFATVLSADRIVVMEAGRIVDAGAHADLLGRCRLYRHLYETQFRDTGGRRES